jgi:ERCC4-type nuclease
MIKIDLREHDLISLCKENGIPIETEALEIGDILLKTETDALIIERKTLADLAASIKDGRFREQKQRLLSAYPPHRITYIIEGGSFKKMSNTKLLFGIQTSALLSSILSLMYRDGFHVIQTSTTLDTMYLIKELMTRMENHPDKIKPSDTTEEYVHSIKVKTKKSENLTPEVVYLLQLGQLPGFSTSIATDIAKVYPSMSLLLNAIQTGGIKLLKDIPGIGPKKAEILVTYLK